MFIAMNQKEAIKFIKNKWNKILEEKGLTISEYNKLCEEKHIERIKQSDKSISFLKHAKSKSDIKYLFRARETVVAAEKKAQEEYPDFILPPEFIEEYTLEVFIKIKPQSHKKEYIKAKDDRHYGDYYSKNVFNMIVKEDPWYIASHEYYRRNINDNADEAIELRTDYFELLKGYKLGDIINK